jgi:aryl-alcohol dehydrogenase-like predicted oxidoreductase
MYSTPPLSRFNRTSPSTSSVKRVEENIAAASLKLDDAEWKTIEADAKKK